MSWRVGSGKDLTPTVPFGVTSPKVRDNSMVENIILNHGFRGGKAHRTWRLEVQVY